MAKSLSSSPPFIKAFIIIVLLVGIGTAVLFSYYSDSEVEFRRMSSRDNLEAICSALGNYVRGPGKGQNFPEDLTELREYKTIPQIFRNPSWPDDAGYVYVSGVRPRVNSPPPDEKDTPPPDPPDTILVFENVPEGKTKIGRYVLTLDSKIRLMEEGDHFDDFLKAQEESWKAQGRRWRLVPVMPRGEKD